MRRGTNLSDSPSFRKDSPTRDFSMPCPYGLAPYLTAQRKQIVSPAPRSLRSARPRRQVNAKGDPSVGGFRTVDAIPRIQENPRNESVSRFTRNPLSQDPMFSWPRRRDRRIPSIPPSPSAGFGTADTIPGRACRSTPPLCGLAAVCPGARLRRACSIRISDIESSSPAPSRLDLRLSLA